MVSRKKRTELDTWSEVKESIAHVDTVSARISRMLTELAAAAVPPAREPEQSSEP